MAVGGGHVQAVDHHEGLDGDLEAAAAEAEHVVEVGALEEQLAGELVVFLVEGAAGDEDVDGFGHGRRKYSAGMLKAARHTMRELDFDTHIFKEGDTYVAYAPAFDVSSCGATGEEARRNISDAVRGFLAASAEMGTLEEILQEAGSSRCVLCGSTHRAKAL